MDPKLPESIYVEPTERYELRRHNGQCAYGPWIDIQDTEEHGIPRSVVEAMFDAIVDGDDADEEGEGVNAGMIMVGGQRYIWRDMSDE